ncbi:hypothetical protein RN2511_036130 [Rhodococcus sp. NKCM2511]|nr:hypothetical protein RN2511_036130 [Rhodococcus sp. NKCM2511]
MSEQGATQSNDETPEPGKKQPPPTKEEQMQKIVVGTEEKSLKPKGVQHFTKSEEHNDSEA